MGFRARIILSCAGDLSNAAVAKKLHTTGFTVGFWRNRFIAEGIASLGDEPRPGAPRDIGDDKVARVVRLTLEKTPKGVTHWSSRMLAARTGLSQSTIRRIWRAFGLKPHRSESFQLSRDLLVSKRGKLLSITHKLSSNHDSKLEVCQARQFSPNNGIAGWRIMSASEITAESCQLENVMSNRGIARRWMLVWQQLIEQVLIQFGERFVG